MRCGIDFKITSINYSTSSDTITVKLASSEYNTELKWNTLTRSRRTSEVEDICEDLVDAFRDADLDPEDVDISFYDDFGDLLDDFEYDAADGDLT
jgi:hypothetical protein